MCFAVLEDFSEKIEVTVFSRTFYQNVNLLVPDTPLVLQGKLDIGDERMTVLADRFWSLEEYLPEYFLFMPAGEAYSAAREGVQKLLAEHPGDDPVHMQLGGRWQLLPQGLSDADEVKAALVELLGEAAVKKR